MKSKFNLITNFLYNHKKGILFILVVLTVLFIFFRLPNNILLGTSGDSGIINYTIIDNIQKIKNGQFSELINRYIFYPESNTLAFTDSFLLHSLIGLPYYLLTNNVFGTYNFIFIVQILIAASGFYFLAKKFTKNIFLITFAGLFYLFLPAFIGTHPQINFYGFIPWMVFFVIEFIERKQIRFLYLSSLAFFLQALVGIYLQVFMFIFTPVFLFGAIYYLYRKRILKKFINKKILINIGLIIIILGILFFIINKPYLDFKSEYDTVRTPEEILFYAPHALLSYFLPNRTSAFGDVIKNIFQIPQPQSSEGNLFLGFTGVLLWIGSLVVVLISLIKPKLKKTLPNKTILFALIGFITLVWVLSLGTYLKFPLPGNVMIPLPYLLLYNLSSVFGAIRATGRMVVLMALPLSLLILVWGEFLLKKKSRLAHIILIFIFGLIILDIFKIHSLQTLPELPISLYQQVENLPGKTFLELPSGYQCEKLKVYKNCDSIEDDFYMFMHIYHNKWLIGGYSGYTPENTINIMNNIDQFSVDSKKLDKYLESIPVDVILIDYSKIPDSVRGNFKNFNNLKDYSVVEAGDENYLLLTRVL